jgi:hypothetical protein
MKVFVFDKVSEQAPSFGALPADPRGTNWRCPVDGELLILNRFP